MPAPVIPSTSAEYVKVPVTAPSNPTSLTVDLAFKTGDAEPAGGDWQAGTWETVVVAGTTYYNARRIVGAGGTVLAEGVYTVWVRVNGSPEVPVRPAGSVVIT